jgi:hypothetical protein
VAEEIMKYDYYDYMATDTKHGERVYDIIAQKWVEYDVITDSWWTVIPQPPKPKGEEKMVDPIVESVVSELRVRSALGVNKYGVTLARDDLSLEQWVQHALEECMDMALYLKRIKVELEKTKDDGK